MKNLLLLIITLLSVSIYAQNDDIFGDKNTKSGNNVSFMQDAGSRSLEVSFNPGNIFGSSSGNAFGLINGGIKYRKFSTAEKATRFGFNMHFFRDTKIIREEDSDADKLELKEYKTRYGVSLTPGFEKHFAVSNRISPYVGMQFLLGYHHTSLTTEHQDGTSIYTVSYINYPNKAGAGRLSVGAGALAGVDYYFIKRFYVGIELSFGGQYSKTLSSKKVDENDSDKNEEHKGGSSITVSPGLSHTNIRLGWTF